MPKADVGVIVGRFQVHRLHDAHRELINSIYTTHSKTIIVLGLSHVKVSIENPLDFEARRQMILDTFPNATVLYIKDEASNGVWSKKLDALIGDVVSPAQTVTLYGGRDSFLFAYSGRYKTAELEQSVYVSGSEVRKTISKAVKATEDFRAGVIWASANQYPRVFPTVDIGIFRYKPTTELLLVRKPNEALWRLPGGFADPKDNSYETSARREAAEETGLEITDPIYVASMQIDDWRYRRETDKITTLLFAANIMFGGVRPADDVAYAQWFPMSKFKVDGDEPGWLLSDIVPEHWSLIKKLHDFKRKQGM